MLKINLDLFDIRKKLYFNLDRNLKLSLYIYIDLFYTISNYFKKKKI